MIRRYLIVAEFDDEQFGPDRQREIQLTPAEGRAEQVRAALQRDVPNLVIGAVTEVEQVDIVL